MNDKDFYFEKVQIRCSPALRKNNRIKGKPVVSAVILMIVIIGCIFADVIMTKDPEYLDILHCNEAPSGEFLFGTDTLGRDIFSMIWYGGRVSLIIGFVSSALSSVIALIYGTASAMAPGWADTLMTHFADIAVCIPSILLILFLQAIFGQAGIISIALVTGLVNWPQMAMVIRTEVRQASKNDYIQASMSLGGSFLHILKNHFLPGLVPSIMFMAVMNIRNAIIAESTLSFLGMGLPVEVISWGSMLSQADKAIVAGEWWIFVIPGLFLIVTIVCMTEIGNYFRKNSNHEHNRFCTLQRKTGNSHKTRIDKKYNSDKNISV